MSSVGPILIVNADDFGQSRGVNRGIIESHELGIVTSTSLMVRSEAAAEAAEYARADSRLSVGLHIDLGEWSCQQGTWTTRYLVVPLEDAPAVEAEVLRQLDLFCQLMGREPTHLDSHQHVHRSGAARKAAAQLARRLSIPLRHTHPQIRYCGDFYGLSRHGETAEAAISAIALLNILRALPEGITELACHPGYADELASDYGRERSLEIRSLCNPEVRRTIEQEGIQLRSFTHLTVPPVGSIKPSKL